MHTKLGTFQSIGYSINKSNVETNDSITDFHTIISYTHCGILTIRIALKKIIQSFYYECQTVKTMEWKI